jgi:hypothetical protein
MAADYHIGNAKNFHGEFNTRTRGVVATGDLRAWDDVADILDDEKIAGAALGNQLSEDT